MHRVLPLCLVLLLTLAYSTSHADERARYDRVAPADKAFVDVVLDLEQAIGEHNFAVVGRNEIGEAVRRRGHPQFGDAVIVHFCNLEYARRAITIDPSLILYMPCRIAVFEQVAGEGDAPNGRVHAASLLLPTATAFDDFNAMALEVNAQIRDIIDYAVSPVVEPATGSNR